MTTKKLAYHLKNISHYYGDTQVLDIDDLKIKQGLIIGLIGPNGSGKSTLLKLLAFAIRPTKGEIFYKTGREYPFSPNIRSKITLLTQKPYLLKRTVFENIAYGLKIRKDTDNLESRIEKVLLNVGLDYEQFAHRQWHELSGGEAQRIALAARLILKPEVLLLDEPIASVDAESAKLIRKASLNAQKKWGATLVVASHDLQWLYSISDKQLAMFKGKLFSTGVENIITGPFEKQNQNTFIKKFHDGQIITLPPQTKQTCNAIIKKKKIHIDLEKEKEKEKEKKKEKENQSRNININQLSGQISSMLLEEKTNLIMTVVIINDLSFVLSLSQDQVTNLQLNPGKKVIIKFNKNDIEWI